MTVADTPHERDAERSMSGDDHLATTRMPSIAVGPLPPARVPPSHPPPALASPATPSGSLPRPSPPPSPSVGTPAPPRVEAPREPPVRSWLRALLASTLPPAALAAEGSAVEGHLRRRVAIACAAFGVTSVVVALIVGFRAAPSEFLMPSAVAASIVLSRALMALGLLGTGVALLRAAERLYFV
jgi:hypothetical protein